MSIHLVVVLAMLAMFAASCGSADTDSATTVSVQTTTVPDSSTTTTEPDTTTSSTESTGTTTTDVPETTEATEPSTTTLPGTEVEMFVRPGHVLGVIGVAHDDVLNLRNGPGVGFEILTTLGPTDDAVATGRARQIPGAFWYEIEANGETGWVNMRFLAYIGGVDDATSQIVAELGENPEAETMADLGQLVAEEYPRDEQVEAKITMTVAPSVGDLGEVTFDVIGLADDSVVGVRLHVFGQPTEGGEGFALRSVERTTLCGRGLAGELCV